MESRHQPAPARPGGRTLLAREALALLLTLALSALLVVMIIFATQAFASRRYDQPRGFAVYVHLISTYFADLLRGQLSGTRNNASAWRLLLESSRRTFALLGISMLVAMPLGAGWGALMAMARRQRVRVLLFGFNTLILSLPALAILLLASELVATLTLRTGIRLTYVQGYGLDQHLLLPAGTLVLRGAAYLARALQIAHDDVLRQEWIRAARARGLSGLVLWRRHVLPALRLPAIGAVLGMLRVMVASLIIVEYLYGWGGIGRRMIDFESNSAGRPENAIAVTAALILVLLFVLIDAVGQLALRYADPRVHEL